MKKYSWHFWQWLAFKLPKPLVYWASIRLLSYATVGQYASTEVPKLTAMEALERWETDNQISPVLNP